MRPRWTIDLVGGEIIVSWPGFTGFKYSVEHRTNLLVGTWEDFMSFTNLMGDFGFLFANNVPADETGFFRIREEE
jgi:hypothetical protein